MSLPSRRCRPLVRHCDGRRYRAVSAELDELIACFDHGAICSMSGWNGDRELDTPDGGDIGVKRGVGTDAGGRDELFGAQPTPVESAADDNAGAWSCGERLGEHATDPCAAAMTQRVGSVPKRVS